MTQKDVLMWAMSQQVDGRPGVARILQELLSARTGYPLPEPSPIEQIFDHRGPRPGTTWSPERRAKFEANRSARGRKRKYARLA